MEVDLATAYFRTGVLHKVDFVVKTTTIGFINNHHTILISHSFNITFKRLIVVISRCSSLDHSVYLKRERPLWIHGELESPAPVHFSLTLDMPLNPELTDVDHGG